MAGKKVSQLTAIAKSTGDDFLLLINDPSGNPSSRKLSVEGFFSDISVPTIHNSRTTFNSNTFINGNVLLISANTTIKGVNVLNSINSRLQVSNAFATFVSNTSFQLALANTNQAINNLIVGAVNLSNVSSNIVPSADSEYDLGGPSNQWRSLYVSSNTIFIGGTPVTVDSGQLVIGSGESSANLATVVYVNSAIANLNVGSSNTGNITFDGVKIIGAGTASGDGNGYATLELVPDNSLYENDQYLVIDPTEGEPPHIHIRAGGIQDDSAAVLILGGERNNVRVYDGTGVRISNDDFSDETYYFYDYNQDFISATWSDDEGNYFIDIRTTDPSNPGPTNPDWNKFYNLLEYPENRVRVYDGNNNYELTVLEAYTLGNPYDLRIKVNQAPPANPSTLETVEFKIYTLTQNYISLEEKYLDVEVQEDVSVYARAGMRLVTGTGSFEIITDDDNNSNSWRFNPKGHLEFPQSVAPTSSKGSQDDEAGSVAFDGEYIYYCTQSYSDGETDIWKRVAWSNDTWGE
jgi:hypothetical protein